MLKIKRRAKESLMINDDIEVIVIDIKNGVAEIGVKASMDHRVLRKEIYNKGSREENGQDNGTSK